MTFHFRSTLSLAVLAIISHTVNATITGMDQVSNHDAVFTRPPIHVPTHMMPDGPLLGNGDVGVVMGGLPEAQDFWIGKNDFWRRDHGDASIIGVGVVSLSIPALTGATYHQIQDLAHAEVRGTFERASTHVLTRTYVSANENLLITILQCEGPVPLQFFVRQRPGAQEKDRAIQPIPKVEEKNCLSLFTRKADLLPGRSREVAVATRIVGAVASSDGNGGLTATLHPGESILLVTSVMGDLDSDQFKLKSVERVKKLHSADEMGLESKHRKWWSKFWSRSFIEIPDKEIEKRWYAALYVLGSCSRDGKVAPGLWGNWITTDHPAWHGDFHLNYNFQAPYYLAYSSNHADLTLPFYQALLESVPNGRAMAQRHGWKGIHFPVCIGPWGLSPEDPDGDWGQRSDAVYASLNFIWQYQYTQDRDFLRHTAYPYLKEVANFWVDYLKLEDGRYVIYNDSIHEGSGSDMNPILTLGLVRNLFKNMIPMSEDLGVDGDQRAKWHDICNRISSFPLQDRQGKTVFRYSEKGMAWNDGNTLGIQHIFPSGAIGLNSDPKLLDVARNTIDEMSRWSDNNGFSSWYTACARVGVDPKLILAKLRHECDQRSYPNLVLNYGGGGIENVSGFLAINEMLMQSHEGIIRFFPVWPRDLDASFGDLGAVGAFLVSANLKNGVVSGVTIRSQRGKPCTVMNPWQERTVHLIRNGKKTQLMKGSVLSFSTSPKEVLHLDPE